MVRRNFHGSFGVSWQHVFNTEDPLGRGGLGRGGRYVPRVRTAATASAGVLSIGVVPAS